MGVEPPRKNVNPASPEFSMADASQWPDGGPSVNRPTETHRQHWERTANLPRRPSPSAASERSASRGEDARDGPDADDGEAGWPPRKAQQGGGESASDCGRYACAGVVSLGEEAVSEPSTAAQPTPFASSLGADSSASGTAASSDSQPAEAELGGVCSSRAEATEPGSPPSSSPVVVLGADLSGLAAALCIRRRTGRAVQVLSIERGGEEGEAERPSLSLSRRTLDTLRLIHPETVSLIAAATGDSSLRASEARCDEAQDGCAEVAEAKLLALFQCLLQNPSGAAGGRSSVRRCAELQRAEPLYGEAEEEDDASLLLRPHQPHHHDSQQQQQRQKETKADALQQETFLQGAAADSRGSGVRGVRLLFADGEVAHTSLLVVAEGARRFLQRFVCRENGDGAPFVERPHAREGERFLWNGHVVLLGRAATSCKGAQGVGSAELALEDAAQLGCSLFDWRFQVGTAARRFEQIRLRRLRRLEEEAGAGSESPSRCDAWRGGRSYRLQRGILSVIVPPS